MKVIYLARQRVAVWIGSFAGEPEFEQAVDAVARALQLPTEIDRVSEVSFEPFAVSITALLEGFSGWRTFSPAAVEAARARGIATANAARVCYYVECDDTSDRWLSLHFLGSFPGSDHNE